MYTYYNMYKNLTDFEQFTPYANQMQYVPSSRNDNQNAAVMQLRQNIRINNALEQNLYANMNKEYKNYIDISNNIGKYTSTANYLSENNNVYHYDDIQDPNTITGYNEPKDIKTAINKDINEMMLYQNSIYITGVIACTTLLIAAIMISKK